jgi:hypothetical protein
MHSNYIEMMGEAALHLYDRSFRPLYAAFRCHAIWSPRTASDADHR